MKKSYVKLLSTLIAALVSSSTLAENHKFEVQVGSGREFFEVAKHDSTVINLGLGYVINNSWTLEATRSNYDTRTSVTPNNSDDINGAQYRLDALYNIDTASLWRPYVAFGAGDQKLKFNASTSTRDTLLNAGIGTKRSLGGNWEFRTDIRAFNSLDEEYTDLAVNAGISYLFGTAPVKTAAVLTRSPMSETEPGLIKDVDSDGDGLLDAQDKCPNTPAQYKVDSVGCPMELTETVAITLAIKFDTNKAVVKDEYLDDIGNLAKFMGQYANTLVTVEGHTDSLGAEVANQKLSKSRAEAVKTVLITQFGITADRITALGFGEAKPLADNSTPIGREENRRVVGAVSTAVTSKQVR